MKIGMVILGALAGNWLGAQAHEILMGERASGIVYRQPDEQGRTMTTRPVTANFFPAVLAGMIGKPHVLVAFAAGLLLTTIYGDKNQRRFIQWMRQQAVQSGMRQRGSDEEIAMRGMQIE